MSGSNAKQKCLVANRSEIACRVFQACRELGIKTVGLYVKGDEEARHLTYADEIIEVPAYLDGKAIIEAALKLGVTLIHPGYGFLSERAWFSDACEKAGIRFVGPKGETISLLGDKIAAKTLADQMKVPTLPWAKVKKGEDIVAVAKRIGYPLLLKAAAGGGGKGMRRVDQPENLLEFAESASREAENAFGDGTLFIERLVVNPRHIEVQVFGDGKGGGVHLYERECSLQRRHQKIWEEARAPNLSDKTREALYDSALRLVRETKYRNAGTIEFVMNDKEEFYFLEMNTRLQVEHPVSELVTGIDLVCSQLIQAMHPETAAIKETPTARGHAIEVRICAEDPAQNFLPSPGQVLKLSWPTGAGIRIETGIEEGQAVVSTFDSMVAKLIVSASTREHAIERLKFALDETIAFGFGNNLSYLRGLCDDKRVREGRVHTHYLETEFEWNKTPSDSLVALLGELDGGEKVWANGSDSQLTRRKDDFLSPWVKS